MPPPSAATSPCSCSTPSPPASSAACAACASTWWAGGSPSRCATSFFFFFFFLRMRHLHARRQPEVRNKLLRSILCADTAFFDAAATGDLTSRLAYDVANMLQPVQTLLSSVVENSALLLGSVVACCLQSWQARSHKMPQFFYILIFLIILLLAAHALSRHHAAARHVRHAAVRGVVVHAEPAHLGCAGRGQRRRHRGARQHPHRAGAVHRGGGGGQVQGADAAGARVRHPARARSVQNHRTVLLMPAAPSLPFLIQGRVRRLSRVRVKQLLGFGHERADPVVRRLHRAGQPRGGRDDRLDRRPAGHLHPVLVRIASGAPLQGKGRGRLVPFSFFFDS